MASFDKTQRRLLTLIAAASAFDGITQGILLLQETIARKALEATNLQITLIGVLSNGAMLLSFFVSYFFSNRNKKWLVAGGYLVGRAIFALAFLITNAWTFLAFLLLYQGLFAIQIPVMNSFFQHRLGKQRGFAFGISRTVLILFTMVTALIVGQVLDAQPGRYIAVLTVIALSALVTYLILFYLESGTVYEEAPRPKASELWLRAAEISRNAGFVRFEVAFMVYGFAFMIMIPAVPVYLLRILDFSYAQMSLAQGVFAQAALVVITPLAGKIFDRLNLWVIGAASFGLLVLYPLSFLLSYLFKASALVYLGYFFQSLGIAGVNFLWNLGSLSFAKDGAEAYLLQGYHISLTGVRGIIGPFVGLLILSTIGVAWNFGFAVLLFGAASILSLYTWRQAKGRPAQRIA